jgi:hypothetical protein
MLYKTDPPLPPIPAPQLVEDSEAESFLTDLHNFIAEFLEIADTNDASAVSRYCLEILPRLASATLPTLTDDFFDPDVVNAFVHYLGRDFVPSPFIEVLEVFQLLYLQNPDPERDLTPFLEQGLLDQFLSSFHLLSEPCQLYSITVLCQIANLSHEVADYLFGVFNLEFWLQAGPAAQVQFYYALVSRGFTAQSDHIARCLVHVLKQLRPVDSDSVFNVQMVLWALHRLYRAPESRAAVHEAATSECLADHLAVCLESADLELCTAAMSLLQDIMSWSDSVTLTIPIGLFIGRFMDNVSTEMPALVCWIIGRYVHQRNSRGVIAHLVGLGLFGKIGPLLRDGIFEVKQQAGLLVVRMLESPQEAAFPVVDCHLVEPMVALLDSDSQFLMSVALQFLEIMLPAASLLGFMDEFIAELDAEGVAAALAELGAIENGKLQGMVWRVGQIWAAFFPQEEEAFLA